MYQDSLYLFIITTDGGFEINSLTLRTVQLYGEMVSRLYITTTFIYGFILLLT